MCDDGTGVHQSAHRLGIIAQRGGRGDFGYIPDEELADPKLQGLEHWVGANCRVGGRPKPTLLACRGGLSQVASNPRQLRGRFEERGHTT